MLYERWRQVGQQYANETALVDLASGCRWTFAALTTEAERPARRTHGISYPQGMGAEFVISVLAAWRWGCVTWPIEPGQTPQDLGALPDEVIHLKTTSASTGRPRVVAFSAGQLAADAANIVATMRLRPEWPNLGVISLAHSYGFSNLVLPLLLHGIPLYLTTNPLPEAVRCAAVGLAGLALPAVPALWRAWHDAHAIPPNLRIAISAGAPLPVSLEASVYRETGLKIHNFYGATECGGIAYDRTETPRAEASSVGQPMEGVRLSLAGDGCLLVQGEAVGLTYWPQPASNLRHGSYHSGDLAEISDGQVHLRGRVTDQINVAGRKVPPEAIEEVLKQHPSVRECLVFGVPSGSLERGDTIVACVGMQDAVTSEELRHFLLATLPSWQLPREWWLMESLKVNQRGKLSRAEWRKRYEERSRSAGCSDS